MRVRTVIINVVIRVGVFLVHEGGRDVADGLEVRLLRAIQLSQRHKLESPRGVKDCEVIQNSDRVVVYCVEAFLRILSWYECLIFTGFSPSNETDML